jgi:Fungal specific transcription factor domain/Fungal Zn(2)-Cys(6) binuclear cluster domain
VTLSPIGLEPLPAEGEPKQYRAAPASKSLQLLSPPDSEAYRAIRARKVKCDARFPACARCISTGRVCDGYGVWGGGVSSQDWFVSRDVAPPPAPISLLTSTSEDKYYFEWFKCRTSKKIPGLFRLNFWNTLVFQASLNEPAVLHAVLALSSVHKDGNSYGQDHHSPDDQEKLMLSNYSKAISHLKPHFSTMDRPSIRVTLIACVLFVCVEFFRGHLKTAQNHLQNGLKVLREMQTPSSMDDDGIIFPKHFPELIDDWILEVFSRLHIQVALFNPNGLYPILSFCSSGLESPLPRFRCLNEAWKELEQILNEALLLAKRCRGTRVHGTISHPAQTTLLERQKHIIAALGQWFNTFELSRKGFPGLIYPGFEDFAFQLLCTYHTMANIMANTCLYREESIFDSLTGKFVSLIERSVNNWNIRLPSHETADRVLMVPHVDLSRSVVDMGWIPPLYYTALKCRVHRLRLQAIRFLEVSTHREGIWDGKITACVARKVMEIEERDFYRNIDTADDFPITSYPGLQDLSLPTLPQSYRIHDIIVDLPDGPMDNFFLSYRQKMSGDWKEVTQEFNVVQNRWIDTPRINNPVEGKGEGETPNRI